MSPSLFTLQMFWKGYDLKDYVINSALAWSLKTAMEAISNILLTMLMCCEL